MALLFMDSFDHYATADIQTKWSAKVNACVIDASNGRRSGGCLKTNSNQQWITKAISPTADGGGNYYVTLGFAFKTSAQSGPFACFNTGNGYQMTAFVNGSLQLSLINGPWYNTPVVTSTKSLALDTWYYIEWKTKFHTSTGTTEIRVNGETWASATGFNSRPNTDAYCTIILLGVVGNYYPTMYYDDVYCLDGSGSTNNDFLGDCRVDAHFPTGDGATHTWTPSTGTTHWDLVDEAAPATADYNTTSTLDAIDTLTVEDLKNAGSTIKAVQVCAYETKDDAGACQIAVVHRVDGTDYPNASPNYPSAASWLYDLRPYDAQGDATAWNEADFNASEFGYKKTA